jgi:hypothetical protein
MFVLGGPQFLSFVIYVSAKINGKILRFPVIDEPKLGIPSVEILLTLVKPQKSSSLNSDPCGFTKE